MNGVGEAISVCTRKHLRPLFLRTKSADIQQKHEVAVSSEIVYCTNLYIYIAISFALRRMGRFEIKMGLCFVLASALCFNESDLQLQSMVLYSAALSNAATLYMYSMVIIATQEREIVPSPGFGS